MPLLKTFAIALKSQRWGEADRIVTLYTQRLGKIRGVARGARRSKSRFGASLEPFVQCHVNLFEKSGDTLYRISQVDLVEPFSRLREDLELMAAAARMVNLVGAVTPDRDPDPEIFDTLACGLRSLQESNDPALTVLLFQIRVLGLTGFTPQIGHCAACGSHRLGKDLLFSPVSGGLLCKLCASRQPARCVGLSKGSVAFLLQAQRLAPSIVTRLKAVGQVREELDAAIEAYVTVVAGRHLPTMDFWKRAARLDRPISFRDLATTSSEIATDI